MTLWAYLLHIGYNMWADREATDWNLTHVSAKNYLRCEDTLWNDIVSGLNEAGCNMIVLDLGEGIRYESHPEIGVEGAWSVARLKTELAKIRDLGMEPIPKLNFSTAHDAWLGPYGRMVSTPRYYEVCSDLIAEVSDIFGKPRFFHLGMDEETYGHQKYYTYSQVRQYDLWWEDLFFYFKEVEKQGGRPWIWSDYIWHHPDLFLDRMPTSALQSNWYYSDDFSPEVTYAKAYYQLEEKGYDQIPTASNWTSPENFQKTVEFAKGHIAPERLLGFLQTVWRPTLEDCRQRHMDAIRQLAQGRKLFEA